MGYVWQLKPGQKLHARKNKEAQGARAAISVAKTLSDVYVSATSMQPARVDPSLFKSGETERLADDLFKIGERFAALTFLPIPKGSQDVRSISWRCKAIANANLLRGAELLRFGILAVNEGAMVTANVLVRALDETLAAIVGSTRLIEAAVASGDAERLRLTLDKLTCGSQYMAQIRPGMPKPYGVGRLIDETSDFLDGLMESPTNGPPKEFGRNYGFLSEFIHPSIGSFSVYQKFEGPLIVFDRGLGVRNDPIPKLLSELRMAGHLILTQGERLARTTDLPAGWPSGVGGASR